jgi:hypothetical protein
MRQLNTRGVTIQRDTELTERTAKRQAVYYIFGFSIPQKRNRLSDTIESMENSFD